jgi:hypothetical protein
MNPAEGLRIHDFRRLMLMQEVFADLETTYEAMFDPSAIGVSLKLLQNVNTR